MIPARIERATRYLGAPAGWEPDKNGECGHLAVRDEQFSLNGPWCMKSAWEPTPEELERLPPVMVTVGYLAPASGE